MQCSSSSGRNFSYIFLLLFPVAPKKKSSFWRVGQVGGPGTDANLIRAVQTV
jgi:hypothetical protein